MAEATPDTIRLRVYGGGEFDPSFGEIRYAYLKNGVRTDGLPQEAGEYLVFAELYGDYAYAGLGGSFTLKVAGGSGRSVPAGWFIAGGAFAVIAAAAVLILVFAKKRKRG